MATVAQQHIKDYLFHEVCKHIHDSVQYLYSAPGTSYLQLMVAARKVESKNEETWDCQLDGCPDPGWTGQ